MSEIKIQRGLPVQQKPMSQEDVNVRTREAAQMYENYFLNHMVKSMRQTVDHSELTKPSMAENIYNQQLDSEYVDAWAKKGGVGLADIIYNQLQERFFSGQPAPKPAGPLPIEKGTTIKIEEGRQQGLPVLSPKSTLPANELSFLYEWNNTENARADRDVTAPYAGDVLQTFRVGDDRQIVKIAHDEGLVSTFSFLGQTKGLQPGGRIEAGDKIGQLAAYAQGLTWQVGQG